MNFGSSGTELKCNFLDLNIPEYLKLAWKLIDIDGTLLLSPLWHTNETQNKLGLLRKNLLQKGGCATSSRRTKRCDCKSSGLFCSSICSYNNCENRQVGNGNDKEEEEGNETDLPQKIETMMENLIIKKKMITFTKELLGLLSDGDDDSDYDDNEESMIHFFVSLVY